MAEKTYNYIKKNSRFKTLCYGTLFFNPYLIYRNYKLDPIGVISDDGFYYYHKILDSNGDVLTYPYISDYDVVSFGGQVAGFAKRITENDVTSWAMLLPVDAYDYGSSNDISSMIKSNDDMFFYLPSFDSSKSNPSGYAFGFVSSIQDLADSHIDRVLSDGGSGYDEDVLVDFINSLCEDGFILDVLGETLNTSTDAEIKDVMITEYSVIKNEASYGHHSTVYNSKATHSAKLKLPFKTPVEKIQQLMQSKHIVFMIDNRVIYGNDWSVSFQDNIQKPLGGGSINPMIRSVSIVTGTLTEKLRRGYYEVDVILHG